MEKEGNKLFKFATKELSQDAFISWCINWINYREGVKTDRKKEGLCKMAEKILDKILENTDINSSDVKKVKIIRQFENIDITLTITTKSLEQYIVILEDKVGANLSNRQIKDLYVSRIIKALENDSDKQEMLELKKFNRNNIIPVFWKTSVWSVEKEKLKKELIENISKINNNIAKKLVCINSNDTLELLKEYAQYSEIVEDFYTCLLEYLRVNNQLKEDEYCVNKIRENEQIKEGTIFSKNYYAYNCFSKLIGKEYSGGRHAQNGGIILWKTSKRIIEENILNKSNKLKNRNNKKDIITVATIRFNNFKTSYKNYLKKNGDLWLEEVGQKVVEQGNFYTNQRYRFLFARKLNAFRKEQYEFLGLYKLIDYDEKNKIRLWERQKLPNNTVPLNEDEIIKIIKKLEKE